MTKPDKTTLTIPVAPGGMPGEVTFKPDGISLRGEWASHTGYRHLYARRSEQIAVIDPENEALARQLAEEHYTDNAALPFLVGAEHRDMGWKDIMEDWQTGAWRVRLPDWHKGVVSAALEAAGVTMTDRINQHWAFPVGAPIEEVREIVRPLTREGTRLMDEQVLAESVVTVVDKVLKRRREQAFSGPQEQLSLL